MSGEVQPSFWRQFNAAPLALQLYLIFLVATLPVQFSVLYAPKLTAMIEPYTGWSFSGSYYLFTIYFAIEAVRTRQRSNVHGIAGLLALGVAFGAIGVFAHHLYPSRPTPNPFLAYHPSRIFFSMALPEAWLLLLMSRMTLDQLGATQPVVPQQAA